MAVSGNSDNEMLLVNNTGLPESNLMLIEKLHSQKKTSLIKRKIRLIKIKYFTENYIAKFEVIENFYSDL